MNRLGLFSVGVVIAVMLAVSATATNEFSEDFHASYPLSQNGRLTLKNITGDIRITVWDRDEIRIDAVKRAYKQERLSEADIVINSSPESIDIRTKYPYSTTNWTNDEEGRYNNPPSVEYNLRVPRNARVEKIDLVNGSLHVAGLAGSISASTVNGRLSAQQLEGPARLSTINGDLEASFDHLNESQIVDLNSVNGSIVLKLKSNVSGRLNATVGRGGISDELNLFHRSQESKNRSLSAMLGGGGGAINLVNTNGAISIHRLR